jgi:nucleotide-binding universal stress UspA family protein
MTTHDQTLLVPVANPETVRRLLDTAVDIARGRSMRVVVIHVVEVPPQVPLSEGQSLLGDDGEERALLTEASQYLDAADVPVESRLRYARDIATGIVSAVDATGADALLMGWRGRPRRRDVVLGSFLDRVLAEAPCDVFVKRIRTESPDIDSILVPVAGGPHGDLAVELAGTLAEQHDATLHLLHVFGPAATDEMRQQADTLLADSAALLEGRAVEIETTVRESHHVAGAITDETGHHDLTVLGATRDSFLRRKLVGSVADGVGRAAASSVILTRRYHDREESGGG